MINLLKVAVALVAAIAGQALLAPFLLAVLELLS